MPEISIIIPTFNRSVLVQRALKSVLEQEHPSFEVIVVDDGSSDDTRQQIPAGGVVKLLVHPSNRGVSSARNSGIRYASGRFIAFLDSDDYWLPGKLKRQAAFFSDQPSAVACQTNEKWIRGGRRVNPGKRHIKPSGDIFERSLELCVVSPSSVMLKKSLFDEVGLFDEMLPACEDYDLWLRIACRHPIHLIPEELSVRESGRADQLSASFAAMDLFRIRSVVKLLEFSPLTARQHKATVETLARKSEIYAAGCIKRGRFEEAKYFQALAERSSEGSIEPCRQPASWEIPVRVLPN
ncbi:MAG TPA: glycosyltransferase family 2 protein [Desulfobacteraceae bacterium]|nr:glycosyltransferase family 2 protein [Desulfobacteraceae bacterium]